MKLVVGIGNPGAKYSFTRHNAGFLTLDFYFKLNNLSWGIKPHLGAIFGRRDDILFIKPQNYYNASGNVVSNYAKYYKIVTSDIMIICDDFNLDFGKIRYRARGSAGGNNGLKSIISALGTEEFPRLRIGTGNDELRKKMGDMDFVLSKFLPEEKAILPEVLSAACRHIDNEYFL